MLSAEELLMDGSLYASYRKNGNMVYLGKLLAFEKHLKYHQYYFEKLGALRISVENISNPIFVDISPSFFDTIDECIETNCWCWSFPEDNLKTVYSSK